MYIKVAGTLSLCLQKGCQIAFYEICTRCFSMCTSKDVSIVLSTSEKWYAVGSYCRSAFETLPDIKFSCSLCSVSPVSSLFPSLQHNI